MVASDNQWFAGGAVAIVVFMAGLFIKEQTDISSISQRESDHAESINQQVIQIRVELRDLNDARGKIDDNVARRIDSSAESLSQRIDIINERLNEIQRQTSAIEGRLGDSIPNLAPLKPPR